MMNVSFLRISDRTMSKFRLIRFLMVAVISTLFISHYTLRKVGKQSPKNSALAREMMEFQESMSKFGQPICASLLAPPDQFPDLMGAIEETYFATENDAKIHVVKSTCTWMQRLHSFLTNIIVHSLSKAPKTDKFMPPREGAHLKFYSGRHLGFLNQIKEHPYVQLHLLGKKEDDPTTYMIQEAHYPFIGSASLCNIIKNPENVTNVGFPTARHRGKDFNPMKLFFRKSCFTELSRSFLPGKYLSKKYFQHNADFDVVTKTRGWNLVPTFFLSVANALITEVGIVITEGAKIHPKMCVNESTTTVPKVPEGLKPLPEVFVLSQYYGDQVYHGIVEVVARIAPYLPILRKYTQIKIHAYPTSLIKDFLRFLDISPNRIVSGYQYAKKAFLPEGTACGFARPIATHLLYKAIQRQKAYKFARFDTKETKRSILLIRRTKNRYFVNHDQVYQSLQKVAVRYGLEINVLSDDPLPSFGDVVRMFHKAKLIVAPHGAGLSNMLFSQPGTIIVEGLCNVPNLNLCYLTLSHLLGHRYYGIPSLQQEKPHGGGTCESIDIRISELIKAVNYFLSRGQFYAS